MCESYCVSCGKKNSINPRKMKAKNSQLMEKSNFSICGKNKKGGALARRSTILIC